ncbi:MAG: hypothetical protein KAQ90_11175, partial [Melioribacteraceae bacterium]|nr:hypothetical protein [Melioribacteraceae bacterium]
MYNIFAKFNLILILLQFSIVNAQNFTIDVLHTEIMDTLGSEIIFEITLINNSSAEMSVSIIRTTNNLPDNWSSSLCFDLCYPPHLDSISTTPTYGSFPLSPGESRESSLHVYPLLNDGTAEFDLKFVNDSNTSENYNVDLVASTILISVKDDEFPDEYSLLQNYPNPFNPSTKIRYSIPVGDAKFASLTNNFVELKVYDLLGREITTLVSEEKRPGNYEVKFNSLSAVGGQGLSS